MKQYHDLLELILNTGTAKADRTGTGTISIFGHQMRFDLSKGFPLVTTKKVHVRSIFHELLWFLKGDTNIKYLTDNKVTIWDEWADENGNLGPVYGKQWRSWETTDGRVIDQIAQVVEQIQTNPNSRRLMVIAYNPSDLDKMALPPCHAFFQFYVANGKLSLQMYQRSADVFLGVPFNIASLYSNHIVQAKLQLSRDEKPLPKMILNSEVKNLFDFKYEDFQIVGYEPHPAIKADIAI